MTRLIRNGFARDIIEWVTLLGSETSTSSLRIRRTYDDVRTKWKNMSDFRKSDDVRSGGKGKNSGVRRRRRNETN